MTTKVDVAIIGGGPAGSTVGTLIAKYNPRLKVLILERERFPRDHVGESQLPIIGRILQEMEVWNKVEAAGFPIKVGATFRWGRSDELWDFDFLANGQLAPEPRPAKYAGQRLSTAFQVDRSIYDEILLNHAKSMGCQVRQESSVRAIERTDDRVDRLILNDGDSIEAKYYVDASGHTGVLRRGMGIGVSVPSDLQNIAIWDYWQNADWAFSVGIEGTRVQVMSGSFGWIWFIPLGPTRTSIGLIVPASYYKEQGMAPKDLYLDAIQKDPRISGLIRNARSEGKMATTKDWSFLADRLVGENWFLAGESAGFADPILAAGMSLAHVGARDVAYTILALERRDFEPEWLRSRYNDAHRSQLTQHILFAEYWYTHNGVFGDLKEYAKELAGETGLNMSPDEAWKWFGQGGFIDHNGGTGIGGHGMSAIKKISASFAGETPHHEIVGKSHFMANLDGADKTWTAVMDRGRMTRYRSYRRDGKVITGSGFIGGILNLLKTERSYDELTQAAAEYLAQAGVPPQQFGNYSREFFENLEAMISDGWITARTVPGFETIPEVSVNIEPFIHINSDPVKAQNSG